LGGSGGPKKGGRERGGKRKESLSVGFFPSIYTKGKKEKQGGEEEGKKKREKRRKQETLYDLILLILLCEGRGERDFGKGRREGRKEKGKKGENKNPESVAFIGFCTDTRERGKRRKGEKRETGGGEGEKGTKGRKVGTNFGRVAMTNSGWRGKGSSGGEIREKKRGKKEEEKGKR